MDHVGVGLSSNNFFNLPFWVARDRGFFAAEDIEAVGWRYESEGENLGWLRSGQTQYTYISTETVLSEVDAGRSLVIIGGNVQKLPFTFVGRPEIASVTDLRGKTVGVSSLNVGTSTLLQRYLAKSGLRYQVDYSMVPVGMIRRRWEALQSGEIDAGMQGSPMDAVALESGYTDLGDVTGGLGAYQFVSLGALPEMASAYRERTVRFLRALARAHGWLFANRDAAAGVAVAETGIELRHAQRAWQRYTDSEVFPRDGDVSIPGIQAVLSLSGYVRSIDSRLRLEWERYVDRSCFVEATGASVGGRGA